jgi:hypothetical protein
MIVTLKTQGLQTLEQVRAFLAGAQPLDFEAPSRQTTSAWLAAAWRRFPYLRLGKADKGAVRGYLEKVTGLSSAQMSRRIRQFRETGHSVDRRRPPARPFARRGTVRCPARPPASSVSAPTRCSAIFAMSDWPRSLSPTFTTSGAPRPTVASAARWTRPGLLVLSEF